MKKICKYWMKERENKFCKTPESYCCAYFFLYAPCYVPRLKEKIVIAWKGGSDF